MCRKDVGITQSKIYKSAFHIADFVIDEEIKKNVLSFLNKKNPLILDN